ncbi:hypothetical protein HDU77_005078 [Chytriomyces hyalinus]|nr:hypothetical protein HDU77_005078 [Chytriomyces hyalinus]
MLRNFFHKSALLKQTRTHSSKNMRSLLLSTIPDTPGLDWDTLKALSAPTHPIDPANGPANAQSYLRLFGQSEKDVQVTLFRDLFAWCPYCHKVWLFLEEKKIPYRVQKVSMFCYGEKEAWYKKIVPSGMLPAIEIKGTIVTESDTIISRLEQEYGPLGPFPLMHPQLLSLRRLERSFFQAWCGWLCYKDDVRESSKAEFVAVLSELDNILSQSPGPFFQSEFSNMDTLFAPFFERAHASLYYYKGFDMFGDELNFSHLRAWNAAMQARETVRLIRADFFTHVHDLPPQLGGCVETGSAVQKACKQMVNKGPWSDLPDAVITDGIEDDLRKEAVRRVVKHKDAIKAVNPDQSNKQENFDVSLRIALSNLLRGSDYLPPLSGAALGLRHLRNQISSPRDMSAGAANLLRQALERTAALDSSGGEPAALPVKHRRDQNSQPFQRTISSSVM